MAVLALAATAAVDVVLGFAPSKATGTDSTGRASASSALVPGRDHGFTLAGRRMRNRVLRAGREHLGPEAVASAFPLPIEGPIAIANLAVAPDGTLVLAVWRFPSGRPMATALEFWRDRRAIGGFGVPPGHVAGGLAFSPDGQLVATFGPHGDLRGVFDRRGRRVTHHASEGEPGGS